MISLVDKCRGCHAARDQLTPVLQMQPMPLAGMFCGTPAEAANAPIFPLTWLHCSHCGAVQVLENIDDRALFARYNYSSSTVPGLVRHFEGYATFLANEYGADRPLRFLEIGCNDGVLLNQLPSAWKLRGCDPSDVAAAAARKTSKYDLIPAPFHGSTVEKMSLPETADVISGSNCLAHISDLKEVFTAAWRALRPGGDFWIEVHDLDALLKGFQWDTIYHEHKVEWSKDSLANCLALAGFKHLKTYLTPMHGGALRMQFRKADKASRLVAGPLAPDKRLAALREAYERRYDHPAARKLRALANERAPVAAYGAAGRANVYLNQMLEIPFAYIVDESPLRMNKFLPRVGTPVVPPSALTEKSARACLITAWNYKDDIVRKNTAYQGEWLTAFAAD